MAQIQPYKNNLFAITIFLIVFFDVIDAGIRDKIHVRMYNTLKSEEDLEVHCKSKNDDLGVHVIPHTFYYEFKFGANIWGNTLFFCGFVFGNKLHWFDIYNETRDTADCWQKCYWEIRESQNCLLDFYTGKYDFCHPWKSQHYKFEVSRNNSTKAPIMSIS